jgi:putative methionine-R-sulfoxide reductase with GAF domain/predicted nucleic acid-binding Zn ribbon protein
MGWTLPRRLYLTAENRDSDLTPIRVDESLSPLLERALFATNALFATTATGAAIALLEGKEMVCLAAQGTAPDLGMRVDAQSGFSGMCVRKGRILVCDDTETDPRVDRAACQRLEARSMIAAPLLDRGKVIGILQVFASADHAFDDNDIRHLDMLAKMTVEALAEMRPARTKGKKLVFPTISQASPPRNQLFQVQSRILLGHEGAAHWQRSTSGLYFRQYFRQLLKSSAQQLSSIDRPDQTLHCAQCGASFIPGNRFCIECGAKCDIFLQPSAGPSKRISLLAVIVLVVLAVAVFLILIAILS